MGEHARPSVLVVLGPTASGKTSVAIACAQRLGGEIISADSRAFFAGLDIVTDTPTDAQRSDVPHHLIDCIPVLGHYDAMAFRKDVARLIPAIRDRGKVPILAGGGTVYLGAVLRGLFEGPAVDEALREQLADLPLEALHRELQRVDPPAAERIHPNDRLRLMRALEVYRLTGLPMSHWQATARPLDESFVLIGLRRDRDEHRQLIRSRIEQMVKRGVFEEIARLRSSGLRDEVQAYRTIGVPEAFRVLNGEWDEDQFVDVVGHRTWQLVRRQLAWFRRDENVHWIEMTGRSHDDVVAEALAHWNSETGKRT